jgi:hypothetical protein
MIKEYLSYFIVDFFNFSSQKSRDLLFCNLLSFFPKDVNCFIKSPSLQATRAFYGPSYQHGGVSAALLHQRSLFFAILYVFSFFVIRVVVILLFRRSGISFIAFLQACQLFSFLLFFFFFCQQCRRQEFSLSFLFFLF